jgi:sulfoxide reductase heme-binding subunit YedZ
MRKLSRDSVQFSKVVVVANACAPAALLVWDAARGNLGTNPLEAITHTTGTLALVFLALSLAVTPLRRLTGAQWLGLHRRTLGLFAFFYAALHLVAYAWFDKGFDLVAVAADVAKRPFILVGMAAFAILVPLAATSTNATIKRLGGKRWRTLHRGAYLAALLAVLHYYLLVKADVRLPLAFAAVVACLLGFRLVVALREASARRRVASNG